MRRLGLREIRLIVEGLPPGAAASAKRRHTSAVKPGRLLWAKYPIDMRSHTFKRMTQVFEDPLQRPVRIHVIAPANGLPCSSYSTYHSQTSSPITILQAVAV
jgi:hypothetical protein